MDQRLADLLHMLELEQLEVNLFRGESRDIGSPQVFGGQVLGQALVAASRTIEGLAESLQVAGERLTGIGVKGADGTRHELPADHAFAFFGLHPKLGPVAEWGLALEKKALKVDTEKFQTSVPGIFAVGDINTYPGKKKLILSGFHEAALAAFGIQAHLYPEKKQFLQYTTTSPVMQKRLGVTSPL